MGEENIKNVRKSITGQESAATTSPYTTCSAKTSVEAKRCDDQRHGPGTQS